MKKILKANLFIWTIILLNLFFLPFLVGGATEEENLKAKTMQMQTFIETLKKESLKESIKNLSNSDDYNYYSPSERKFEQSDMQRIYGNRRYWKIKSELSILTGKNAALACEDVFAENFSNTKKMFTVILNSYRDPNALKNTQSMEINRMTLSASLLLSSLYCEKQKVLKQVQEVLDYQDKLIIEITSELEIFPATLLAAVKMHGFVQNKTILNIYMNMLSSVDIAWREKLAIPCTMVLIAPWDSNPEQLGIQNYKEGTTLNLLTGWTQLLLYYWTGEEYYNDRLQYQKLKKIRKLLQCKVKKLNLE